MEQIVANGLASQSGHVEHAWHGQTGISANGWMAASSRSSRTLARCATGSTRTAKAARETAACT
eukprot:662765-Pleurochrysis_carterae.AAC.1